VERSWILSAALRTSSYIRGCPFHRLVRRILATDRLIDLIVYWLYWLYGLTAEDPTSLGLALICLTAGADGPGTAGRQAELV
jgi:hypothetical protein